MRKLLVSLLLIGGTCFAQDCIFSFELSGAGDSAAFPNTGCIFWNMTYKSTGFSGLSILLQQAPDVSGSPGVWINFAGTTTLGGNPSTSTTGAEFAATATVTNLAAWIRVDLSALTGSGIVSGRAFGYRTYPGASGSSGGSGCTAPCVVIGPDAPGVPPTQSPVQIATTDSSGNVVRPMYCNLSAAISLTASGFTQLVALSAGKQIQICDISAAFASGVDFQLVYGTGVNCATGTTALTGVYKTILTVALDFTGVLAAPASQALCANLGSAVTGGGVVSYGLR